jgi:hypothetical protein
MKKLAWLFFAVQIACASPYPLTGSSHFVDNKTNLFLWPFKIDLNLQKSSFEIDLTQGDSDKWTIKTPDPAIQVFMRIRQLGPKEDYDKTLKGWIREYEKSGFQIVSQQIPTKEAERGWIHLQDGQEKQLVQYFRYKSKMWVYFNCLGKKDLLTTLKQDCEYLNSTLQFR